MQLLFEFIRAFRDYIVFTVLASVCIVVILNSNEPPVRLLRSATVFTFATLQSSSTRISNLFSPRADESILRDINVELLEEVMQLRRLQQENLELRRKIGFRERSSYPLIPAEIIGKNLALGQNMLTLDVGVDDGVRVNMPIINQEGLVGKVVATSARYSIGMIAIHRDFRATAKIKRSRIDGFITWKTGQELRLQNVDKTADVLPGDTIVTSEYSNIFPSEVLIGTVRSIGPDEGGLFSLIIVQPFVDFSSLERVFIVQYVTDPERESIEDSMYSPFQEMKQ